MRPVLFTLWHFDVPSYGVFVALGILAAVLVSSHFARKTGVSVDFVLDGVFWAVVAGFVGARAAYLMLNWRETLAHPLSSVFSGGGGIFIAGAAAGMGAVALLSLRKGIPFLLAADILAPGLAIAHALGRVGCFLAGCCYGRVVPGPLEKVGTHFPRITDAAGHILGSWAYIDHVRRGLISPESSSSLAVYPTQLIEATLNLVLFAALAILLSLRGTQNAQNELPKWKNGCIFLFYLLGYAVLRFSVEFLRGDVERGVWIGLSLSQWLCLGVIAISSIRLNSQALR